jgi:hypothetical protein
MSAQRLTLTVVAFLTAALAAAAQQPQNQPKKLPRTFAGIYEAGTRYRVTLVIEKAEEKDGVITFVGKQTYLPYDLTETATGRIDVKEGKISFRLSDPTKNADIDGAFVGTISPKLEVITCIWMRQDGTRGGELKLTAREP